MGVKTAKELQSFAHARYLTALSISRFVESVIFEEAYGVANSDEQVLVNDFISSLNKAELVKWTRAKLRDAQLIETLNMTELRRLGQELGVRNYSTITRLQLLSAVTQSLQPINGCVNGTHKNCVFAKESYEEGRNVNGSERTSSRDEAACIESRRTGT